MRLGESYPQCSLDFTNVMTEYLLAKQAAFHSPEREFVWDYVPRHSHLSIKGKQVLKRLLALLSFHLESQVSTSFASLFPPAFLFSICDVLKVDGSAEQDDTSALPFVLGRLRDWRLLDPNYRYSSAGIHELALGLAGITGEASASTSFDTCRASHGRLRMKWVGFDPPSENLGGEPFQPTPPALSSSRSSILDSAQNCAHVLADLNRCRPDAHESCLVGRLGTPDSEDSSAVAASGFRSGCSACRHPRVSGASTPPSPLMTSIGRRTPFGDTNQLDTHVGTSTPPPGHSKAPEQHATAKRSRKDNQSLQRTHGTHADENEPPLTNQRSGNVGISFPRQRAHPPRISNASSSRERVATSAQRRIEPSRLPIRTREGDKRMSSHRVASTSVDLVLPIARYSHSPRHTSSIDLHRQPNRARSLSSTLVTPHAVGSVAQNPKLSSNTSGKLLPFWNQSHRRDSATTTPTRSVVLKPDASSVSSSKTRSQQVAKPWTSSRFSSDARGASPRPLSSVAHRHTQSAGSALPSPRFTARKWHV